MSWLLASLLLTTGIAIGAVLTVAVCLVVFAIRESKRESRAAGSER